MGEAPTCAVAPGGGSACGRWRVQAPVVRVAGVPASSLAGLRCERSFALAERLAGLDAHLAAEGAALADALYAVIGEAGESGRAPGAGGPAPGVARRAGADGARVEQAGGRPVAARGGGAGRGVGAAVRPAAHRIRRAAGLVGGRARRRAGRPARCGGAPGVPPGAVAGRAHAGRRRGGVAGRAGSGAEGPEAGPAGEVPGACGRQDQPLQHVHGRRPGRVVRGCGRRVGCGHCDPGDGGRPRGPPRPAGGTGRGARAGRPVPACGARGADLPPRPGARDSGAGQPERDAGGRGAAVPRRPAGRVDRRRRPGPRGGRMPAAGAGGRGDDPRRPAAGVAAATVRTACSRRAIRRPPGGRRPARAVHPGARAAPPTSWASWGGGRRRTAGRRWPRWAS